MNEPTDPNTDAAPTPLAATTADPVDTADVVFYGKVHPASGDWYLDEPVDIDFPDGHWTIQLRNSDLRVMIHGDVSDDFPTFTNEVVSVVRGVLDAMGFFLAAPLTLELTEAYIALSAARVAFIPGWPELIGSVDPPRHVTAPDLAPFIRVGVEQPLLRLALADLSLAIAYPDDTGFFAYRAVESVRHWLTSSDGLTGSRDQEWQHLRATLGFTSEQLDELVDAATPRRHGESPPISEGMRLRLMTTARAVVTAALRRVDMSTAFDGSAPTKQHTP